VTHDRIEDFLRGDVLAEDPAARERARVRLRALMALEGARRPTVRRRSRLPAFAAASLAAAIVLLVLQQLLPTGPAGPGSSAAAEIRQLGRLSSEQASLEMGAADYLYRREEAVVPESSDVIGSGEFTLRTHVVVERWIMPDGSGRMRTVYESVDFASPGDRQAWQAVGSPELPATGGPPTEVDYPRASLVFYAVDQLPTEPAQLELALSQGDVIEEAPGDANRLSTIGTLLAQGNASSDLRQALFEVAAGIPEIVVDEHATDPIGRAAVSVSVTDASGQTVLFFDAIDASLLGTSRSHPATDEATGSTEWHAYRAWGVASAAGERPSSQLRPSRP
jgi:hypothetical protein